MKKIKNFFYYEWKKILALVFVVVFTFITVKQCSNKVATDFGILYVSEVRTDNFSDLQLEMKSSKQISDVDSDGKVVIKTKEIYIPKSEELKLEQQIPQQIQFEIISGEATLFIVDKGTAVANATELSFADITSVVKEYGVSEDLCLKYPDGKIYAVPIDGNKLFKKLGIRADGMYIAQRNYLEKDKNAPRNLNALKAIEYILNFK